MSICEIASLLRSYPNCSIKFLRNFSGTCYLLSHYDTLKVKRNASLKEIKDAYFSLSKKYHPDLHPNDPKANDRFIKLKEAYEILSNVQSKKQYDSRLGFGIRRTDTKSPPYPRPYAYPDYSKEWEKYGQKERAAEFEQFRKDYERSSQKSASGFNRYQYSKPHNLSPEEMKAYYNHKRYLSPNSAWNMLIGALILFGVVQAISSFSTREDHGIWGNNDHRYNPASFQSQYLREVMMREQMRKTAEARFRNDNTRRSVNVPTTPAVDNKTSKGTEVSN